MALMVVDELVIACLHMLQASSSSPQERHFDFEESSDFLTSSLHQFYLYDIDNKYDSTQLRISSHIADKDWIMQSEGPPPEANSNTNGRRIASKRKRETPASRLAAARSSKSSTPNAYARRTPPRETPRQSSDTRDSNNATQQQDENNGNESPPRKLTRPGGGSRIAAANREAAERERKQREEAARLAVQGRVVASAEIVAEHYNAVPERGREWRSSESKIKGLRSLNNWIKSTLIQKFSRPENPVQTLKVLDMACGKGGDLGKWQKAPQVPGLYVGCDIASKSIEQAQDRYNEDSRRGGRFNRGPRMHAEFYVHDTFGRSLGDIKIIRDVGFNPNAGPGPAIIQGGMMSGGFDVVSMMFALHYSFETEELARGMLRNVAGALVKGGHFIGVMPNSDVISANVKALLAGEAPGKTPVEAPPATTDDDDWDPEKPASGDAASEDGEWDPEKPSDPQPATTEDDDDWDPEKPSEPVPTAAADGPPVAAATATPNGKAATPVDSSLPDIEWGNDIYKVRFPRLQTLTNKPLPRDGIFRPPFGWRYHYSLEEAVDAAEFVVPWEAFRALAEDYGLELQYRKGFRGVLEDETEDRELGMLAERMKVMSRDRSQGDDGLLVTKPELEAAYFYHAFCFRKT
jgi:mRNA (guanine-N7-)-methyltransferase